ncbi:jg19054 [Pararge aegeria aegeria]|uniref:Jg19054 protein n=1 Tax=Pararge aegeria aegeria TaxID=348720 RepID=A0A8S4SQM7_9NEOP|nr:jg19054 [Pararge aegeria aegeria]
MEWHRFHNARGTRIFDEAERRRISSRPVGAHFTGDKLSRAAGMRCDRHFPERTLCSMWKALAVASYHPTDKDVPPSDLVFRYDVAWKPITCRLHRHLRPREIAFKG